jgi:hypothetical protein
MVNGIVGCPVAAEQQQYGFPVALFGVTPFCGLNKEKAACCGENPEGYLQPGMYKTFKNQEYSQQHSTCNNILPEYTGLVKNFHFFF